MSDERGNPATRGTTTQGTVGTVLSNPRALAWGALVATGVFGLFGIVTGLVPNPLYVRMVPRTPVDYVFLTTTAVLTGGYGAQRIATDLPAGTSEDATGADRWAIGGLVGGFLAVGCPVCNVLLLALVSSSVLLTYFDPLRPLLGIVSVAILGGLVYVRHRRTCPTCRESPS